MRGRQITDNLLNIRTALQAIEHQNTNSTARGKNKKGKGAAIIGLDFEKAYDRVERDFLYDVMERMEFPVETINFLKFCIMELRLAL